MGRAHASEDCEASSTQIRRPTNQQAPTHTSATGTLRTLLSCPACSTAHFGCRPAAPTHTRTRSPKYRFTSPAMAPAPMECAHACNVQGGQTRLTCHGALQNTATTARAAWSQMPPHAPQASLRFVGLQPQQDGHGRSQYPAPGLHPSQPTHSIHSTPPVQHHTSVAACPGGVRPAAVEQDEGALVLVLRPAALRR